MSRDNQQQQLERIAYQSWLSRGCPVGSPEVDWDHACKVVGIQLTVIDKAEALKTSKHSTFDELGSEEDTPSDPNSLSPFAAAAQTESSGINRATTAAKTGKTRSQKQTRSSSTNSG